MSTTSPKMTGLIASNTRRTFVVSSWLLTIPPLATLFNIFSDTYTPRYLASPLLFTALADSVTHAVTGVLLTIAIFIHRRPIRPLIILACLASTLIDLDHFICARSLSLEDAILLPKGRPFLHDTIVLSLFCCLVVLFAELRYLQDRYNRTRVSNKQVGSTYGRAEGAPRVRDYVSKMVTLCISLLAHHTRDALRRGFCLTIFSTRAISYPEMMLIFYCLVFFGKYCADKANIPQNSVFTV